MNGLKRWGSKTARSDLDMLAATTRIAGSEGGLPTILNVTRTDPSLSTG